MQPDTQGNTMTTACLTQTIAQAIHTPARTDAGSPAAPPTGGQASHPAPPATDHPSTPDPTSPPHPLTPSPIHPTLLLRWFLDGTLTLIEICEYAEITLEQLEAWFDSD